MNDRTSLSKRKNNRHTDHRSDQNKVPIVYFHLVTTPGLDLPPRIKIGKSSEHEKRIADLGQSKAGIEFKHDPLCVIRGTGADESHLHRYFAEHKLANEREYFWPHQGLIDYIRWLRDQYFVWVPDCEQCPDIKDLDVVDASFWMPRPERIKNGPPQVDLFTSFGELNLPPREITVDDFYTNEIIIEAARRTMGGIDLDPASHAYANQVVKANNFCTIYDNGLLCKWRGRVWLNPPFSSWNEWAPKLIEEWNSGEIEAACILCATRTLTAKYLDKIRQSCDAVCIFCGRIPFWGGRAASQYLVFEGEVATRDSWGVAWEKIPGICRTNLACEKKPYLRDLYYVRGILRNRIAYVDERYVMELMEECINLDVNVDQLKELAKTCNNWTHFRSVIQNTIEERK